MKPTPRFRETCLPFALGALLLTLAACGDAGSGSSAATRAAAPDTGTDAVPGGVLDDGSLIPAPAGNACDLGTQCASGFCVDQTCCEVATCPAGEFCNTAGAEGRCAQPPTPLPVALRVGSAAGEPGYQVTFAVVLDNITDVPIAGAQNDLTFDSANTPIAVSADGTPDCFVNPDINKSATAFAFHPIGCAGAGCSGMRAVVLAFDNVDPIPPGSVLYWCRVDISRLAADGAYPLAIGRVIVSDPSGVRVQEVVGVSGAIAVASSGSQPAQLPPSTSPTPPPPPSVVFEMGSARGAPGTQVTIAATFDAAGALIAGMQNDLAFDVANASIAAKADGSPDCAVNPDINKGATAFSFPPLRCTRGVCTVMRAIVFALDNVDPIPDGSLLYTCQVDISPEAPAGEYPLRVSNVVFATPRGQRVQDSAGTDGVVVVEAP